MTNPFDESLELQREMRDTLRQLVEESKAWREQNDRQWGEWYEHLQGWDERQKEQTRKYEEAAEAYQRWHNVAANSQRQAVRIAMLVAAGAILALATLVLANWASLFG